MKKSFFILLALLTLTPSPAFAALQYGVRPTTAEQARVIKEDKDNNDLIVERKNGEIWLIQHTRECSSMTSEFPVSLLKDKTGKIVQLKVNFNEVCTVNHAIKYTGEAKLQEILQPDTHLIKTHLAKLDYQNKRWTIDFGEGCMLAMLDYVGGKRVYVSLKDSSKLDGGTLVLPESRGHCAIKSATAPEDLPVDATLPPAMTGFMQENQVNQVYFYWTPSPDTVQKPVYLISYSRYSLDPSLYAWTEMPNLKVVTEHEYTVPTLATGRDYYFYFAVRDANGKVSPWTMLRGTPIPGKKINNNPDPDAFQITFKETASQYLLSWPLKTEARKYTVKFYIKGKLKFSKNITTASIAIDKLPEYKGQYFRLTVETLPAKDTSATFHASYAWGALPPIY